MIVGADFAPSSLPPALRIRFFAGHLHEYGWQPTVLTADPRYYEWSVDPENLKLIPPSVRVIRTGALPAGLTRKIGFGDIGIRALPQHWATLVGLCRRHEVDLLYIPVPPYFPMLLGRLIHALFRVPYVVDYIDPWVTDYYWKLPPHQRPRMWPLVNALARISEPFALGRVSHITGVSQGTTDGVRARYPWISPDQVSEIPYGGETGDIRYVQAIGRPNPIFDRDDGLLHVSYTGVVIPAMHVTLRALFAAVRQGLTHNSALFSRLRMHFVGTNYAAGTPSEQVLPLAREEGIAHLVDERPSRVPYLDALRILLDSHGLLAVGTDEAHYTASKIFPLIMAARPLLVIFHEASSVVNIVQETGAGNVITYSARRPPMEHVQAISTELEQLLYRSGAPPPTRWEAFEPYTTRAMTARLARAFECALARG